MNNSQLLSAIGEHLRSIRNEHGISQERLAEIAGVDRTYVGGVERGERNISILSLAKLCKALNLSVFQFFEGLGNEDS